MILYLAAVLPYKLNDVLHARLVQVYNIPGSWYIMKTLAEVEEIVGLTRRMIQEYEKYGLAKAPASRNWMNILVI